MGRKSREKWKRRLEEAEELIRRNTADPMDSKKSRWGFLLTYWGTWFGWLLGGLSLTAAHFIWASVLFFVAFAQITAGMWLWFGMSWRTPMKVVATVLFTGLLGYADYGVISDGVTPVYVYVV